MSNFGTDDANMGGVLTVNPGKILTIVNSNFTNNQIWANQNNGGAGVLYNAGILMTSSMRMRTSSMMTTKKSGRMRQIIPNPNSYDKFQLECYSLL